jgi:hypothetical protein
MAKGEDLKTTGVGQDRPLPTHHLVESSQFANRVGSRPDGEMVCVGEDHLGANRTQLIRGHPFYGALGSDRHESGSLDLASRCRQGGGSRTSLRSRFQLERKTIEHRVLCFDLLHHQQLLISTPG